MMSKIQDRLDLLLSIKGAAIKVKKAGPLGTIATGGFDVKSGGTSSRKYSSKSSM